MGHKVEKLGDLIPVIEHAKSLLPPLPKEDVWLPYLGETLDAGAATLFAFEAIEGIRFAKGEPDQRCAGEVLGHPAGGRPYAWLRRDSGRRQE